VSCLWSAINSHENRCTTSDFSSGARAEAERVNAVPVALMNGEQLVRLLVEHEIGVRRESYDLIEMAAGTDTQDVSRK
jgi:restriction endonuclease Mrr